MDCSLSLLTFKLENAESRNPLECLMCDQEFVSPVRLQCHHSFCQACIIGKHSCPVCNSNFDNEPNPDNILSFLIETSHEEADACANCDRVSQPMYFCETCQQALCHQCRYATHQAKMFSTHRLVPLEERARVKNGTRCVKHDEPFILCSTENQSLACIVCFNNTPLDSRHHLVHVDAAHKLGCEKLDKATTKLRHFQDDIREQIQIRKRLVTEVAESHRLVVESIQQTSQQLIDTVMMVRDRLLKALNNERNLREEHFLEQIRYLTCLQPSVKLYLLSASIFCSSASKLDFLQSSNDLLKRIQSIITMECEKPLYTGELIVDSREEFGRALEPFLGFSTFFLSTGQRSGETIERSSMAGKSSRCTYVKRSSSGYVSGLRSLSTKYQMIVDLAGAFGEEFTKVDIPLRKYNGEVAEFCKKVQEIQKDLTLRRCLIDKGKINELIVNCADLDTETGNLSKLIYDLQPKMQEIWQEQLDRVRRQQLLFRKKVEETITLRENAKQVAGAAKRLEPFVICLSAVASVINPCRTYRNEMALMESLCVQINTIEPNSQQRIDAIEKEEQNRRVILDRKKRQDQANFAAMKKSLKNTGVQKKLIGDFKKDSPRIVNTNRDRSRGGTDRALLSPCYRKNKGSFTEITSHSDGDEADSTSRVSFDFVSINLVVGAEITLPLLKCRYCISRTFSASSLLKGNVERNLDVSNPSYSTTNDAATYRSHHNHNTAHNDSTLKDDCVERMKEARKKLLESIRQKV